MSKAFDTIDHSIILKKLEHYGIRGTELEWFVSYLSNRQQFVELNNTKSTLKVIRTGVPQGSIIGPLLFLIYIIDLATASTKLSPIMYADDTTLFTTMANFQHNHDDEMTTSDKINIELTNITDWLAVNKLSLNENKTKVMILHSKQRKTKQHEIPKIVINHKPVEVISQFKFLGVIIDSNLAWTPHLNSLAVTVKSMWNSGPSQTLYAIKYPKDNLYITIFFKSELRNYIMGS